MVTTANASDGLRRGSDLDRVLQSMYVPLWTGLPLAMSRHVEVKIESCEAASVAAASITSRVPNKHWVPLKPSV